MPSTWYVTFEIRKRGSLLKKERSPRETKAFETEAEAKLFAREKLNDGMVVFAGTINPHLPKMLVFSHSLVEWLGDDENHPTGLVSRRDQ